MLLAFFRWIFRSFLEIKINCNTNYNQQWGIMSSQKTFAIRLGTAIREIKNCADQHEEDYFTNI